MVFGLDCLNRPASTSFNSLNSGSPTEVTGQMTYLPCLRLIMRLACGSNSLMAYWN